MPGNTITLNEPAVNALIGTWTGIRLERGPNATNLGAFSIASLIPYVFGQTQYTYFDASGATSDWYRIARYGPLGLVGPYSPAWPVLPVPTTTGGGARRSRKSCRRMLGRRLGSLQVATTTSDGEPGGTTVISTGLSTVLDSNRYRGWWAMPTDGVSNGQIRVVGETALNPLDGTMLFSPSFTSQIVAGTEVEFSKLLPHDELGGLLGLHQALNLALAECWVMDRLALVGVANQATYDISALGDWLDPESISEFYGPVLSSSIRVAPWGGFAARQDGGVINLDVPPGLSGGAAMALELTRPADTVIKINGVWTDQQQGFQNDTDECLLQPAFLVEVALAHCWESLAQTTTGAAAARYAVKAEDQRKRVNIMKFRGLPHPVERSDHRVQSGPTDWWGWVK
jgi:hypothetical protein